MNEIISSMLTPAVMINVCALLLLSTVNRNSRVVDRIRSLNRILACGEAQGRRAENYEAQLELFMKRGRLIRKALSLNYSALLAFILSSISLFLRSIAGFTILVPLLLTVAGFMLLAFYALMLISESSVNFKTTEYDYLNAKRDG